MLLGPGVHRHWMLWLVVEKRHGSFALFGPLHAKWPEAARALGLKRLQIFRFIIIFPALKTVYPALASQFILLMLSSSVVSTISAVELTAITNSLQSTTFRAFEFYFVATGLYLAMALGFRAALSTIYWAAFQRGRPA